MLYTPLHQGTLTTTTPRWDHVGTAEVHSQRHLLLSNSRRTWFTSTAWPCCFAPREEIGLLMNNPIPTWKVTSGLFQKQSLFHRRAICFLDEWISLPASQATPGECPPHMLPHTFWHILTSQCEIVALFYLYIFMYLDIWSDLHVLRWRAHTPFLHDHKRQALLLEVKAGNDWFLKIKICFWSGGPTCPSLLDGHAQFSQRQHGG